MTIFKKITNRKKYIEEGNIKRAKFFVTIYIKEFQRRSRERMLFLCRLSIKLKRSRSFSRLPIYHPKYRGALLKCMFRHWLKAFVQFIDVKLKF